MGSGNSFAVAAATGIVAAELLRGKSQREVLNEFRKTVSEEQPLADILKQLKAYLKAYIE